MGFPRHPLRPLLHALGAILGQIVRPAVWAPFALLAVGKGILYAALARLDLLPVPLLALLLAVLPDSERLLHYPDLLFRLPKLARFVDLGTFLVVQPVVQGWVIVQLARRWTSGAPQLWPDARRGPARLLSLVAIAALLVAVPYAVLRAMRFVGDKQVAAYVALGAGACMQMLLLAAPAFVVAHGMSCWRSIRASIALMGRLPVALPLVVLLLVGMHLPALLLRGPAIAAGRGYDPDWVLLAILGQIPADAVGALAVAGLGTYFALRTSARRSRRARTAPAAAALLVVVMAAPGCDTEPARSVSVRFASERWIRRAELRQAELLARAPSDTLAWRRIAAMYDRALVHLPRARLESRSDDRVQHQLAKLTARAVLGRAAALARAGQLAGARADYEDVFQRAVPYRGVRADALLGLARADDSAGRWDAAYATYQLWLHGVEAGDWPLRRNGLDAPVYVARRLRDRGRTVERRAWVERATATLEAAAARDELPQQARYTRFVLLVAAERWEEAHAALRQLRSVHDPTGRDGALLVAEASLLAGGLRRQREALGILAGLHAEKTAFDSQHRVAGWLLAAQIHARDGDLAAAQRAFESAAVEARSEAGRSEALLGQARVHAARGDIDASRRLYAQLRGVYRGTPAGLLATIEELRLLRARGDAAAVQALLPGAVRHYRTVMEQFGTELPALLAAQHLGDCLGEAGGWEQGVAFLDSVSATFRRDARAGTLLVRAARLAIEKLDDAARARELLARLHARYPDSDVAVLARAFEDSLGVAVP